MPRLYLIRHAEPAIQGVLLGQMDPPLSAAGHLQAALAMAQVEVSLVYCSPLRRACETAAYLRAPKVIVPAFAEISFGEWAGLRLDEVQRPDRTARHPYDLGAPGGDSWDEFVARVQGAFSKLQFTTEPVAIAAHGVVNSVIHHLLTGEDPGGFLQSYAEFRIYEVGHGRIEV